MSIRLVRVFGLLAIVVAALSLSTSASARFISFPATPVTETKRYNGNDGCASVTFVRWSHAAYPKAQSASASWDDGSPIRQPGLYGGNAPGFVDNFSLGADFPPPAGMHQVVLGHTHSVGHNVDCPAGGGGNFNDLRLELYIDDQPRAGFTAKRSTIEGEMGKFAFDATSYSPVDRPLLNEWDLGDGTTHTGDHFFHEYEKPGYYQVKLKAIDTAEDLEATATQTIHAPAPSISTSILWDEDIEVAGRLPLDEPIDVTVRVRATDGVGDLSNLDFQDGPVHVYDGWDNVELELDEPDPEPFTLAPLEHRDFKATLTARQTGDLTLESTIEGEDAAGDTVYDSTSAYTRLGQDFQVEVRPSPEELDLDFDPVNGKPIPKPANFDLTVTNVSGKPIENAKLDMTAVVQTQISRNPSAPKPLVWLQYTDRDGNTDLIQSATAGGQIVRDLPIGDFAAGETVTLVVGAQAQEKARVRVTGIVRGVVDDEGDVREAAGSDRATVRIGQPTLLRVLPDNAAVTQSKAGQNWVLSSTIENVSPSEDVTVRVLTHKQRNTIGKPVDDSLAPTKNPMGLIKVLAPGERLLIRGDFSSDPDGGTRSIVDLMVDGWVEDAETGEERELLNDEIAILDQPNGDPATRREVSIDTTNPPPSAEWTKANLAWYFSDGMARGFGRWVDSTLESVQAIPIALKHAATWMLNVPATVYANMDPATRAATLKEIKDELGAAYAALKKVSYAQARAAVDNAIQAKLQPILTGYETGDVELYAGEVGKIVGEAAPELIIESAISAIGAYRVVSKQGLGVLAKADEAQEASKAARVASKGMNGFEPGDAIDYVQAKKYWGMDATLHRRLQDYLKDKDIVVAMRDRSPGSIKRMAEGALGKIEMVKSKNVSQLDVDFLGFAEGHLDFAMYKQMDTWPNVLKKIEEKSGGLSFFEKRELQAKVKARWKQRAEEYVVESKKMNAYIDTDVGEKFGKIPVPNKKWGLNPNGNIDPEIEFADVWDQREFKLAEAGKSADVPGTTDGLPAFQPQIMGETLGKTGYKPLTGDMDLIAIVDKNGKILPDEERFQIYRDLAEMGFQHPESLTWNNKAGRAKYLKDYDYASGKGSPLLAYGPKGDVRAIKIDTRKWATELLNEGFKGFMMLQGMEMTWSAVVKALPKTSIGDGLPNPADIPDPGPGPEPYPGPPGADEGAGDLDRGEDAPLVRKNRDGSLSVWDKDTGRWVPAPAGTPNTSVPQTALKDPTETGDTSVAVLEQSKLGLKGTVKALGVGRAGGTGTDWFVPGDQIVVNPGGANEERVTVSAVGASFTVSPLAKRHWPGETVALIPAKRPAGVDGGQKPDSDTGTVPGGSAGPSGGAQSGGTQSGGNTPPPVALVRPLSEKSPKITGTVRVGRQVTCAPGTWSGTAPLTYAYAWETKTKSAKKWTAIKRQTKPKLKVPSNTAKRQLRCTVTAKNAAGSAAKSSAPKTVARR